MISLLAKANQNISEEISDNWSGVVYQHFNIIKQCFSVCIRTHISINLACINLTACMLFSKFVWKVVELGAIYSVYQTSVRGVCHPLAFCWIFHVSRDTLIQYNAIVRVTRTWTLVRVTRLSLLTVTLTRPAVSVRRWTVTQPSTGRVASATAATALTPVAPFAPRTVYCEAVIQI